MEDILSK